MSGGAANAVWRCAVDVRLKQFRAKLSKARSELRLRNCWVLSRADTADSTALLDRTRSGIAVVSRWAPDMMSGIGAKPLLKERDSAEARQPGTERILGNAWVLACARNADSVAAKHAMRLRVAIVATCTADVVAVRTPAIRVVERRSPKFGKPGTKRRIGRNRIAAYADEADASAPLHAVRCRVTVMPGAAPDVMLAVSAEPFRLKQFCIQLFQPLAESGLRCHR
jgi:hypothetical protein